ncbi:MAG: glycoside hydrolase family 3 N-terminal domain-containing protein [Lachnospiraceae bacterium]|nr:glycoside hydrolase family 3 N-terminal domain-containing protein [Lachnospiraceae bacterium]
MEKYLDQSLTAKERAMDLLSRMSPEEKMAQVGCVLIPAGREKEAMAYCKYGIGEVSTLEVRMMEETKDALEFQKKMQKAIMENSPHHIPAIFHMEGLCGGFIQGNTSFPSGIGRASSWDPGLEQQVGGIVARQENAVGFTHTLAPVLDISRDARMGRQGETYGEDPTLAAALGTAFTKGIQEEAVTCPVYENGKKTDKTGVRHSEAVAKHFMGFHNSEGGIHGADSHTPPRLMREVYGKPFQAAISEAQLRGVMPCYCTFDGEPASASKTLLTDILREEMGFDGLAVSDYSGVENIHNVQKMYESVTEAGLHAMEAGMDVEMPMRSAFNDELTEWFKSEKADPKILDRAVLRVLEAKFRMGLFEHPFALEGDEFENVFYRESDEEVTLQSARESMILLKNDGVLPLKKGVKKIALVGCHGANARSFFGGYTHISMVEATHAVENSIAGIGESAASGDKKTVPIIPGTQIQSDETEEFDAILRRIKPDCPNLQEQLKKMLPDTEIIYAYGYPIAGNDMSGHEEALKAIADADLCIMTLGGKHGSCSVASMGEGVDSTDINLPLCQESFIRKAAELGKPLIGVHFNGRAISSNAADECLNAIVEAWNPSEKGAEAIVEVLTGAYNPSGKLPVSVAYTAGQLPLYYNHMNGSAWHQGASIGFANYVDMPHTPRYCFGHGLSYTTFAYGELTVDRESVRPDECVKASVKVKNTGTAAGTEVVQLYLKDVYASMTRPVMELGGFARVELNPGEEKTVTFEISPEQTAFLDTEMRWKTEAGEVQILIGSSSEDIRSTGKFVITEDQYIQGKERRFYARVTETI